MVSVLLDQHIPARTTTRNRSRHRTNPNRTVSGRGRSHTAPRSWRTSRQQFHERIALLKTVALAGVIIALATAAIVIVPRIGGVEDVLSQDVVSPDASVASMSTPVAPEPAVSVDVDDTAPEPVVTFERTEPEEYLVEDGQTLSEIALRFGLDYDYLATFNHLDNPHRLAIGQHLLIPPAPEELQQSE